MSRFSVQDQYQELPVQTLCVGDTVKVVNIDLYTHGREGKIIGIVPGTDSLLVNVRLRVLDRVFTYNTRNLQLVHRNKSKSEKDGNNMSKTLTGFKRVAEIRLSGKLYSYALYDEDVLPGSKVFVTGRAANQLLVVENVCDATRSITNVTEEVIAVVDDSKYLARQEKRAKAAELRKRMDEAIARADENDKYARYAQIDPNIAELYSEYSSLLSE